MDYKDILVYLDDGASNTERTNTAFALAKSHQARLTGVTLSSIVPTHLKVSNSKVMASRSKEAAKQRIRDFIEATDAANIESNSLIIQGNENTAAANLAKYARNFDLLILRQANPKNRNFSLVEEVARKVILVSGRPVFFMPYIGAHHIPCQSAMIAWDGTPTVTRAIHDALPILKNIGEVIILVVQKDMKKTAAGEPLADDLASHLKRHGINAYVKRLSAGSFDISTVILNEISENDIDLLVMGGYGTPSLQQKIFGGVTRSLLSSMITPIFISH